MKPKKRVKLPGVPAWAWEVREGLCAWTRSTRNAVASHSKPSKEAKVVRVQLIKPVELLALVEAAEGKVVE